MKVTNTFIVDMARPSKSNILLASQNDSDTRIGKFVLMSNGYTFDMENVETASVTYRTPSGATIKQDATIETDESGNMTNVVDCIIPAVVTKEAGQSTGVVTLRNETDSLQITSFEFYIGTRNELLNFDELSNATDITAVRSLVEKALESLSKVEDLIGDSNIKALPNPKPLYVHCGENDDGTPVQEWTYIGSEDKTITVGDVFYGDKKKPVDAITWNE